MALTFKEVRRLFQVPTSGHVRLGAGAPVRVETHSVLIVLQASDAAGKDGTIKHVMSGVKPQGCQICAFKKPSSEELDDINAFERHLTRNGTLVLKFFLNVSKKQQRERFLERLERPEKNWKFSFGDLEERKHWSEYRQAFEQMVQNTSTKWAPWWVIPADHKWVTRTLVAGHHHAIDRRARRRVPEGVRQGPAAARGRQDGTPGRQVIEETAEMLRERIPLAVWLAVIRSPPTAIASRRRTRAPRSSRPSRRRKPGIAAPYTPNRAERAIVTAAARVPAGPQRLLSVLRQRLQRRRLHPGRGLPAVLRRSDACGPQGPVLPEELQAARAQHAIPGATRTDASTSTRAPAGATRRRSRSTASAWTPPRTAATSA